jgi:antitoxin component YwqK of YwqJK toxin-antitoxin module
MKTTCLLISFVFILNFAQAQNEFAGKYSRSIRTDSSTIVCSVNFEEEKVKKNTEDIYYWIKNGQVHFSQGDYFGNLLNGQFTESYPNGNLWAQGRFVKGKKTGKWLKWHVNGKLMAIEYYKDGLLHGQSFYYNESGKLLSQSKYKKGLQQGNQKIFDDSVITVLKFEKGNRIIPRNAKEKKNKIHKENIETDTSEPDQTLPPPEQQSTEVPKRKRVKAKK